MQCAFLLISNIKISFFFPIILSSIMVLFIKNIKNLGIKIIRLLTLADSRSKILNSWVELSDKPKDATI